MVKYLFKCKLLLCLFCAFAHFYCLHQKQKKTVEELAEYTDKMIATIVNTWNIGNN